MIEQSLTLLKFPQVTDEVINREVLALEERRFDAKFGEGKVIMVSYKLVEDEGFISKFYEHLRASWPGIDSMLNDLRGKSLAAAIHEGPEGLVEFANSIKGKTHHETDKRTLRGYSIEEYILRNPEAAGVLRSRAWFNGVHVSGPAEIQRDLEIARKYNLI